MARQTDIRLRRSAVSGSVPTTSNLNLGELALNTADGKVYMKKSVGGTDTVVEVGGNAIASTFTAYEYTATANQTTFSGSDNYSNTLAYNTGTPPSVQVFMNGILLDEGSSQDYTGTNGTSVVLTTGADAGDLIQIHAYKSDVSVSSNINFGDNKKLQFGDAQDLQIYHDGSNSYINDTGTGALFLKTNYLAVAGANGNQLINAEQGAAIELYHANAKKLETTNTGIRVTGTVNVNGAYTLPTSDGSSGQALVSDGSGALSFATVSGGAVTSMSDADGDTKIQVEESSDEDKIRFDANGVEIVRMGFNSSSESTLEIVRNGVPAAQGQLTFNGSGLITNVTSGYHSLIVTNGSSEHLRVRSNGNVGIGESSPGQKLQVNGNIRADGHYYVGGQIVIDSNRRILAADGAANVPYITFAADTNTGLYRPGTDILGFSTAGSERVRIDASGRVGINQSNPSHKLQVSVDANGAFIKRDITSNAANLSEFNSHRSLLLLNRNAGSYLAFGGNGSRTDIQATDLAGTPTAKNIALNPFGGSVGIGITSPTHLLHVNGTTATILAQSTNAGANASIWFNSNVGGTQANRWEVGTNISAGSSFEVYDRVNGASRMVINSSGSVGIGTTAPQNTLHVNGTLRVGPYFATSDRDHFLVTPGGSLTTVSTPNENANYDNSAGNIHIRTNTGYNTPVERLTVTSGGQVGIGTTSPGSYAADADNLVIYSAAETGMTIASGTSSTGDIYFADGTSAQNRGFLQYHHADDSFRFGTAATERMRIDASGRVGIGTSNPTTPLDVHGIVRVQENSNTAFYGGDYVRVFSNQSYAFKNSGGTVKAQISMNGNSYFNGGNVGIGTISPTARLDVRRGDASGKIAEFHQNTGYGIDIGSSQAVAYISSGYNQRLDFKTDPTSGQTERMSILANGHVGIGTTSPTAHSGTGFVVHATTGGSGNTGSPRIRLTNTTTGQSATDGAELSIDGNTKDFYIENREGQDIIFYSGSERMRIDTSGYLLVGKTNSSFTTNGTEIRGGNLGARIIRQNAEPLTLHRQASDGAIINLYKDSAQVGSIGSNGTYPYIGSHGNSGKGLKITDALLPATNTGGFNDADVNLGASNVRWKDLYLSGKAHIGHAVIDDYAVNTSATSAAQVDTFAAATFRTARYTIQITNTTDSTYHVTELLLIHDGTTPSITEYGTIYTGGAAEATFDADIVSGNVRLLATPASSDTMQFKVVRHSILV